MAVVQISDQDGREIDLRLRPMRTARRFSLRVSQIDGRVTLTYPRGAREKELRQFVERNLDWLRRNQPSKQEGRNFRDGLMLPIEGQEHRICLDPENRSPVHVRDGCLVVPCRAHAPARRAAAFLKLLAREKLAQDVELYCGLARREPGRLTLRDTRSRWGSCSFRGDLMFSWRLVMAPVQVRQYVVAHEVAHLTHMDHSQAFWGHLGELMPGYEPHKAWLKQNGRDLQAFQFD